MFDTDLREELEVACLDAMGGDPPGPGLARRLEREVTAILRRRKIPAAVRATSDARGTRVHVAVGRPGATVRAIVLTLGE